MDYNKCRFNKNKLKEFVSFDINTWIHWVLPYQIFNQLREPTEMEYMELESEINVFCKKQINE